MSYEDVLIRESTGEGLGLDMHWCSTCQRNAEDCVCDNETSTEEGVTMEYTREDYMSGKVSHADYYGQFVTPQIKAKVEQAFGYALRNYPHDEHLNDIPLAQWDALAGSSKLARMQGDYSCERIGPDGSLSSAVCTLKQAAKQIMREASQG